jgi:acetyltransferase-like isoleucine patch superfamily enzyme
VKILDWAAESKPLHLFLAVLVYLVYAALIGVGLAPSAVLTITAFNWLIAPSVLALLLPRFIDILLFCVSIGISLYLFFFCGLFVIAIFIRLLSRGLKPGRYPTASLTVLRWMVLNGAFTFAYKQILHIVPMTFFSSMFYKVVGTNIGKNVWINTNQLIDPYLITIGDNTIIGGEAVLSCHTYENNFLILGEIRIGTNCLIGAHSYISPGVTIEDDCLVGMHTLIRKNTTLKQGSNITTIANVSPRTARRMENE